MSCRNKAAAHMQSVLGCTTMSRASTPSQNAHMALEKMKGGGKCRVKTSSCFCWKERGTVNTKIGLTPQLCKQSLSFCHTHYTNWGLKSSSAAVSPEHLPFLNPSEHWGNLHDLQGLQCILLVRAAHTHPKGEIARWVHHYLHEMFFLHAVIKEFLCCSFIRSVCRGAE